MQLLVEVRPTLLWDLIIIIQFEIGNRIVVYGGIVASELLLAGDV